MNNERSIGIKSVGNARQLGGYVGVEDRRVRDGVLLRSGHLAALSNDDGAVLAEKYRLEWIIDLRTSFEQLGKEDRPVKGALYEHVNIMDESAFRSGDGSVSFSGNTDVLTYLKALHELHVFYDNMYIDFLEGEQGKQGYRRFFEILLACGDGRAVLWHCASGKDRTGLAAMLVLTALGVDEGTILDDYMLTNRFNRERIESTRALILSSDCDDELADNIALFGGVYEKYMMIALDHLKKEYGSPLGYIRQALHVSESEVAELQRKFLV